MIIAEIGLLKRELQLKTEEIILLRNESLSQKSEVKIPTDQEQKSDEVVNTTSTQNEETEQELIALRTQLSFRIEAESRALEKLKTAEKGSLNLSVSTAGRWSPSNVY